MEAKVWYTVLVSVFVYGSFAENSLPTRLEKLLSDLDTNTDDKIDTSEIKALQTKLDPNKDGCLTETELEAALFSRGFSLDYSKALSSGAVRLYSTSNPSCSGITISQNPDPGNRVVVFLNTLIEILIEVCESDDSLYRSNADCRQLPMMCRVSETGCNYACYNYLFNITRDRAGEFPFDMTVQAEEFQNRRNVEDIFSALFESVGNARNNRNSTSRPSNNQTRQVRSTRDSNGDGCLNQWEFAGQQSMLQCGNLGFTLEHTARRYYDIAMIRKDKISDKCAGLYGLPFKGTKLGSSDMNTFRNHNIGSMISMCEDDRRRYRTNRDCRQIFRVCTQTVHKKQEACKDYVDKVFRGKAGYAYSQ